jgi:hypothetical protein
MIDTETERIIEKTNCKWLEKLIGAVFISNAKVLSTIRTQNFEQKMKLEIPTTTRFIHKCYIESGREFYRSVYLFDDEDVSPFEKQKNIRECLTIVKEAIQEAIRRLLPVQEIIKTYLGNVYQNSDDDVSVLSEQFMNETLDKYADQTLKENILSREDIVNEESSPKEIEKTLKQDNTEQITLLEEFVSKNESSDRVKTHQDEVVEKLLNSDETTISDEILKQLSDHEQSNTNEENFEDQQELERDEVQVDDQVEESLKEIEQFGGLEEENIETESFHETETKEEQIIMENNLIEEESSIVTENIDANIEKELEKKYKSHEKQIIIKDKKKNALREKLIRRQAIQKRRNEEEIMKRKLERKIIDDELKKAKEERQRIAEESRRVTEEKEQDKHDYVFFGDEKSDEEDYEDGNEGNEVINYA